MSQPKVTKVALLEIGHDLRDIYYSVQTAINRMLETQMEEPNQYQIQQIQSRIPKAVDVLGKLAALFPDELGVAKPTLLGYHVILPPAKG